MIKPLKGKIVIKPDSQEETTEGGIVLVQKEVEKPTEGEVAAVYDGCEIRKGQRVLFSKFAPISIEVDEEEFLILDEEDILAIL